MKTHNMETQNAKTLLLKFWEFISLFDKTMLGIGRNFFIFRLSSLANLQYFFFKKELSNWGLGFRPLSSKIYLSILKMIFWKFAG